MPGVRALAFLTCLGVAVYGTLAGIAPPRTVTADAPAHEFSAERALQHLRRFGTAPRSVESDSHRQAAEYLASALRVLGAETVVQTANVPLRNRPIAIANVMGRFRGEVSADAVLMVAHYDTVPISPGAADNGAAVAALLETARTMRHRPRLRNDVIVLFTDAEELGLHGARLFVSDHPWARDVRVAVNFDARGTAGPALMFETSSPNADLIGALQRGRAPAAASSLMPALYRLMSNDTDFTIFRRAGVRGLNIALLERPAPYHSRFDTIEALDPRSLQHQGEYATALANELGRADLRSSDRGDVTYFSLPGGRVIAYPHAWQPLVTRGAIAMLALGSAYAWWTRRLRPLRAALAVIVHGLIACGALFAAYGLWWLGWWQSANGHVTATRAVSAFAFGAAACMFAASPLLHRWFTGSELLMAIAAWWTGFLALAAGYLPDAQYLFVWPLVIFSAGLLAPPASKEWAGVMAPFAVLLACVLAIALIVPMVRWGVIAFGPPAYGPAAMMAWLIADSALPLAAELPRRTAWVAAGALSGCAIVMMLFASRWQ